MSSYPGAPAAEPAVLAETAPAQPATPGGNLSLAALSALVVGSMVGGGVFSLPQTFGRVTGVLGAFMAWSITGTGMLMLALVFQTLSQRKPALDAGIYTYARAGFGEYVGFLAALGYCSVACAARRRSTPSSRWRRSCRS
jgi:arginine:ornithine antiporter / lysine permease